MPEEERRRLLIDLLIERKTVLSRPLRLKLLKASRDGLSRGLTTDLRPVLSSTVADSITKFLAAPVKKGIEKTVNTVMGVEEEK